MHVGWVMDVLAWTIWLIFLPSQIICGSDIPFVSVYLWEVILLWVMSWTKKIILAMLEFPLSKPSRISELTSAPFICRERLPQPASFNFYFPLSTSMGLPKCLDCLLGWMNNWCPVILLSAWPFWYLATDRHLSTSCPLQLQNKSGKGTPLQSQLLLVLVSLGMDNGMCSNYIMIKNCFLLCISMSLASHFG